MPLITPAELHQRLGEAQVKILDATYHVPPSPRRADEEFRATRLPGARFFDIDTIADPATTLPHMLPNPADFAQAVEALGIGNEDFVVVYDAHGLMSAPRAWWMFRVFGHPRVAVLDGGLPRWQREGYPVVSGPLETVTPGHFRPAFNPAGVVAWETLLQQVQNGQKAQHTQVLDLRSAGRFAGVEPEPRAGLRGGHIPGSANLPWNALIDPETKTLLPPTALRERFISAGVDPDRPVVTTCGSGVTACVGALALAVLGQSDCAVYDGAWAEWGSREDLPVSTSN